MVGLEKVLIERLRDAEKLVILGAGLLSNADAAAGLIIAENLKKQMGKSDSEYVKIIIGGDTPDKYTEEIRQYAPDHLLIIDTADVLQEPASLTVIQPDIMTGVSYVNHMLPVRVLAEYVKKELKCGVTILGIQPADVTPGREITPKVKQTMDDISGIIKNVVFKLGLA